MWLHGTTEMENGKVYSSYKLLNTEKLIIKSGADFILLVGNKSISRNINKKTLMAMADNI